MAGVVVALALCCALARPASAQVALTLPQGATPGQAFEVTAVLDPAVDAARVELLYRSSASPEIRALLMTSAAPRQYQAVVPGEHVAAPGVELIIRLWDRGGQSRLVFKDETEQRPYVVSVGEASAPAAAAPPSIAELIPKSGGTVVGRRPTLVLRLAADAPAPAPGQVMITIDGVDMSPQLEFAAREIRLRPASALTPGPHSAVVTFLDAQGQPLAPMSWPFTIRDYAAFQEGSLGIAASGTYEYAVARLTGGDPRWTASANVHVGGRLAEGGFEATLDGDLRYLDQNPGEAPGAARDIDLASHLLTMLYGRGDGGGRLEVGELAVRESPLTTGASFARRGSQLHARAQEVELRLFATSVKPLIGFDNFTGLEEADQLVHGASLAYGPLGERLTFKLTALDGRSTPRRPLGLGVLGQLAGQPSQQALQAYNVGSAAGGFETRTYSAAVSSRLLDGRLRAVAEHAWSRRLLFTAPELGAEADERGWQNDDAWFARVEGDAWGVRTGAEYRRIAADFASPANPTLVADREDAVLDLQTSAWITTWQLQLSRGQDNVRNASNLPRTTEWKITPSVTLAPPGAPALTLNYLRSDQTTERAIVGQPRGVLTQGGGANVSYATPLWSVSLAPSYQSQEGVDPRSETDTRTLTFAAGFTPAAWLNVGPSYTFTRTRDFLTHTDTDTHTPTLTARLELVPDLVTFDTQSSYVSTADNKEAVDTATYTGLARLSVSLKRFFPAGLAPALGLRFNYARTEDRLVATNRREDYGVFLILDVSAAVGLLPVPTLDWQPSASRASAVAGAGARF